MKKLQSKSQIIIYKAETGETKIDVRFDGDTVWLTQKIMAELFDCSSDNISLHLKNIFNEGELSEKSVTEESSATASDGKQNETLEKIAQAVFKRWFVEFEFPDKNGKVYKSNGGKMVDSELGEIPEGWRVGAIKDFGKIICGKTPSKDNSNFYDDHIPFIKIPDMHNQIFIIQTEDSLSKEGGDSQKNKYLPENSICVSCIATVGLVSLTITESQTNQQINSIIPKGENWIEYIFFTLKRMSHFLNIVGGGGTATLNINTGIFSGLEVLLPDLKLISFFHKTTEPIFNKIKNNFLQIQTLTKTRDTLLPKLMSGEVRVNN